MIDTPLAARLLDVASHAGLDLRAALAGDDAALRPTDIAQPALLLTEVVLASALPGDIEVVGVAGHSVGEYAAVAAAGALGAEAAMGLVIERGRRMAQMGEGTMAAVLGLDEAACAKACAAASAESGGTVVIANLNAPGQVVISGSPDAVEAAGARCREAGARRVLPLSVSGAFHSPLMAEAADGFGVELDAAPLVPARIPVVCNVDAAAVTSPDDIRGRLRRQLVGVVRWVDCAKALLDLGAEVLVEVGPGSVLSGLNRRIIPGVPTLSVNNLEAARGLGDQLGAVVGG